MTSKTGFSNLSKKQSDRHGERNQRVFLKAKVIQASSQLNPDRDKILSFLDNH